MNTDGLIIKNTDELLLHGQIKTRRAALMIAEKAIRRAQVLLSCWKHVSQMRQDAGDTPLPEGLFWIKGYKQIASPFSHKNKSLFANVIMRR